VNQSAPIAVANNGGQALTEALRLSFRMLRGAMLLILLGYLASGIFIVHQHERALVLLFGNVAGLGADRVKEPGLHWTWPRPFSEVVKLPTERVQSLTSSSFWYGREADFQDNAGPGETLRPGLDGYLLTGDANLLHGRWAVRYTIAQPLAYRFGFADVDAVLLAELDRAVVRVSARFGVDRALRTDLEAYREAVEKDLRARADELALGVRIQGVDLLGITPPRQVAESFDAVTQSAQERAQAISDARAYAVRAVNEAQGDGERIRSEGEAFQQARITDVKAQADTFERIHGKWKENPDMVARTLLQDGVRRALSHVEQKFVVHAGGDNQEIRLQLGPEKIMGAEELK
jgi:membrane protease subunit HflK